MVVVLVNYAYCVFFFLILIDQKSFCYLNSDIISYMDPSCFAEEMVHER